MGLFDTSSAQFKRLKAVVLKGKYPNEERTTSWTHRWL